MSLSPHSLKYYQNLISKTTVPIINSVFPKEITSRKKLSKYLHLNQLSKNISIPNKVPIESFQSGLLDPCYSMIERKGKQWRPTLGLIASSLFINDLENIKKHKKLYQLLYISDLFHNASLIIDDIMDKSIYRRGKKCVHLLFPEDVTINAGFALFVFPIHHFISTIKNNIPLQGKILKNYMDEMTSLFLGQGWDASTKCSNLPQIQTYIDTVLCKTGVCPRLVLKMVKIYVEDFLGIKTGKVFNKLLDLCDDFSVAFQIWDDLMNLVPSKISKNKGKIGEDITEGKLTIMVLHTLLGNFETSERLKEILTMKTKDQELINEAIKIMVDNGSIEYSQKAKDLYIKSFEEKCYNLMEGIGIGKVNENKLNLKNLNALIELKNSLIKV